MTLGLGYSEGCGGQPGQKCTHDRVQRGGLGFRVLDQGFQTRPPHTARGLVF